MVSISIHFITYYLFNIANKPLVSFPFITGIKAVNGDWTLDDCLFFRKLTVGKTFVSVIKDIKYDNETTPPTQILELELIDVTTDEDILIHELLLNEKRAITE